MNKSVFLASIFLCFFSARADEIAFCYALDADFSALKAEGVVARQPVKIGERSIQVVSLGKHKVYAVKMGSGAVETAISTQALFARFRCDRAYSLGPVGALSDDLTIGKWYRVKSFTAYQKGSWGNGGFQLNKNAVTEFAEHGQEKLPALFDHLSPISVASGEIFITSDNYREQLRSMTSAQAVDMNLFGLATVCADHHVPLVNWRIVSDKADDNAGEDFRKFVESYKGEGGKALAELIKNLPLNPNSPESYPELQKLLKEKPSSDTEKPKTEN